MSGGPARGLSPLSESTDDAVTHARRRATDPFSSNLGRDRASRPVSHGRHRGAGRRGDRHRHLRLSATSCPTRRIRSHVYRAVVRGRLRHVGGRAVLRGTGFGLPRRGGRIPVPDPSLGPARRLVVCVGALHGDPDRRHRGGGVHLWRLRAAPDAAGHVRVGRACGDFSGGVDGTERGGHAPFQTAAMGLHHFDAAGPGGGAGGQSVRHGRQRA
ncbi:hypothetical protein D3C72_994590 [compost metagenome]